MIHKLSIIIPAYNEEKTISLILDKVISVKLTNNIQKEIIVVNDCSKDDTKKALEDYCNNHKEYNIRALHHEINQGKGAALHTGIKHATGEFLIIQDADDEYDPREYNDLLKPVLEGHADVVYGSRFMGGNPHRILFFWHSLGNKLLTALSNMFTNLNLSDMETCYKLFKTDIIQSIELKENRFGFEPEVTAKIARVTNIRIYEVGISYYGRTYADGKKIGWRDGFRAIYCILKYGPFNSRNRIKKNKIKSFDLIIFFMLLFSGIFFHIFSNIGLDFSKIPGDLGDSRFNNYILENGYLYITGINKYFWDASFMFPMKNIIALSDSLMGTMPFYGFFRMTGLDAETSFQSWFICISLLNFLCAAFIFYKLSNNLAIASIGAYIFAFNIVMVGQYNHLQTLPKFIIPFAFYFLILFFKEFKLKFFLFALLAVVYQFYCGMYLGFLLTMGLILFFTLNIAFEFKLLLNKIKNWKWTISLMLISLLSLCLLFPLMKPYYTMSKVIGVWDLNSFFYTLPSIKSYFFIVGGNLIWPFFENTGKDIPIYWEHFLFVGGVPIVLMLFYIYFIKRFSNNNKIFLFTLLLLIILTIRIGDFSFYRYIYNIPGFGSMRALGRIIHIELFFFSIIAVSFLSFAYNKIKYKKIFIILTFCTLLIDQYFNPNVVNTFNKVDAQQRTEYIIKSLTNSSVQNYSAFAVCAQNNDQSMFINIDAMLASQAILKPTINGYSSTCVGPICDFLYTSDTTSLYNWLYVNNINKDSVLVIKN